MWNLFGRYKGKKVLPSARQMNLIASILNHVCAGTGIRMEMPQQPSTDAPWRIYIDVAWLKKFVGGGSGIELSNTTPPAANNGSATSGGAGTAARGDHRHPLSTNTLTAAKWVRVDSSGNLETPSDQPVTLSSDKTGETGTQTVVTGVTWNGTKLQFTKRTLTLTNGVVTARTAESTEEVDTPTVITWS